MRRSIRSDEETALQYIAPGDLRPWARNARTQSKKQLRQIADSIRTFFTNPVLIDEDSTILAGPAGSRRPRCSASRRCPAGRSRA